MKIYGTAKGGTLSKKDFGVAFGGGGATPDPDFQSDFSSSDDWTTTGNPTIDTTEESIFYDGVANGADNRIYNSSIGTVNDEKWCMRFKFNTSAYNIPSIYILALFDAVGNPVTTSQSCIGLFLSENGRFMPCQKTDETGYIDFSVTTDMDFDVSTDTDYYCQVQRTSETNVEYKIFSDSTFETQVGSTSNMTVTSSIDGLDVAQTATQSDGSSSRTMSANLYNLQIWDDYNF